MQSVYLELPLFISAVWYETTKAVEFVSTGLQWYQLALEESVGSSLVAFAYNTALAEVFPILDRRNFFHPFYSEILIEF